MFYTIDDYYDINFYNSTKEALKNNKVQYSEFIEIKSPYHWYFNLDDSIKPVMVNYDTLIKPRYLVSKVIALQNNEEYILQRRTDDSGQAIQKYIYNDAFNDSIDTGILFHIKSRDELLKLSRAFPGKIYYLGKYRNNKFRVCLCNNTMIKNYILPDQILLEKTPDMKEIGRFEAEFNYRVLKLKDYIVKYTKTIYAENGILKRPTGVNTTDTKTFI